MSDRRSIARRLEPSRRSGLELDWAGVCWDSCRVGSLAADSERFLDNGQFEFLQAHVLCCEDTFRHLTLRGAGDNT
jgi:hypothetical protein